MLWTALHLSGVEGWESKVPVGIKVYKPTHKNHPTSVWVRSSRYNFRWTAYLAFCLCEEYTLRYGKIHACEEMTKFFMKEWRLLAPIFEQTKAVYSSKQIPPLCTPPPLAMPEQYHRQGLVSSYRAYYRGDKSSFAEWKYCEIPIFMKN